MKPLIISLITQEKLHLCARRRKSGAGYFFNFRNFRQKISFESLMKSEFSETEQQSPFCLFCSHGERPMFFCMTLMGFHRPPHSSVNGCWHDISCFDKQAMKTSSETVPLSFDLINPLSIQIMHSLMPSK